MAPWPSSIHILQDTSYVIFVTNVRVYFLHEHLLFKLIFLPTARTHRMEFEKAMDEWERATCIHFDRINDYNNTEEDYIIFTNRTG